MNWLFLSILSLSLWMTNPQTAQPAVRVVLFYSPQCGHCHYVIEEILPPLMEKYGAQMEIIGIDVSQPQGSFYFQGAIEKFNLQAAGVPMLVIGDEYLIGSGDIPEKFPGLIEKYLAAGGVDYPDLPGLREAIAAAETEPAPQATASDSLPAQNLPAAPPETAFGLDAQDTSTVWERVARDPLGNGLSIALLAVMLAVAIAVPFNLSRFENAFSAPWQQWLIPGLSLIGFVVAGYLAYVETAQVTAVCGPVGDCNTVQQSDYARLFGFLPIGVMGLLGYVCILAAWLLGRLRKNPLSAYADLAVLAMTGFGLIFSIYLTFLEPFVIGATCAWCLSSALLMTLLFLLSIRSGKMAYTTLFG
ncbi:MAG: vitamin K epoxide reductase family protein [Anaerolineales bacterium]|nr:vitamin K epoxide reductase family protein [Anaerolineales bacterium]